MGKRFQGFAWLLRSSFWILGGSILGQISGIAATLMLTRALGAEQLGYYSLLIALVALTSGSVMNALSRSQVRFVSRFLGEGNQSALMGSVIVGLSASFVISLLVFLLFSFSSSWLASSYLRNTNLEPLLYIVACIVPFGALLGNCGQTLRGLGFVMDKVFLESILRSVLRLTIFVTFYGSLSLGLAVQLELAIYGIVACVSLGLVFLRTRPFQVSSRSYHLKDYLGFTLPLIPAMAAAQFTTQLPLLSMGWFSSIEEVAIFAVCFRIAMFGRTLVMSLNSNFAPMISHYQGMGRDSELNVLYRHVARCILIVSSLWVSACIIVGADVINLFGSAFIAGHSCLITLSFYTLPIGLFGSASHMIIMSGHTKLAMNNSAVSLFATICFLYFLVPAYGAVGAALSMVLVAALHQAYQAFWVWRLKKVCALSFPGVILSIGCLLTASIIHSQRMGWLAEFSLPLQLFVALSQFVIVFLVLGWLTVSSQEKRFIADVLRKHLRARKLAA